MTDGQGGLICFFDDFTSVDNIRAQRVDANGNRLWGASGALVQAGANILQFPMIAIPDGSGGGIVGWTDTRNGTHDVFAQRLDANGNLLWSAGGVHQAQSQILELSFASVEVSRS